MGIGAKAYSALENLPKGGTLVIVTAEDNITSWQESLSALGQITLNAQVLLFPPSDRFERITTLNKITAEPSGIIITTNAALSKKTFAPNTLKNSTLVFENAKDIQFDLLIETLVKFGYSRIDFVEDKGQFSRRGEVLDIWPSDRNLPVRVVFMRNNIESIKEFEVSSQRSEKFIGSFVLAPAGESGDSSLKDYLPKDAVVFDDLAADEELAEDMHGFKSIKYDVLSPEFDLAGFGLLGGNYKLFSAELAKYRKDGYRTVIFASNEGEKERIEDILQESGFSAGQPDIFTGTLPEGFSSPKRKLAVFTSLQILYKKRPVSFPKFKTGRRLEGLWEINSGDYVVHEKYGIGKYLGLKKITRGGAENEYLCLEYKGGDRLYVPVDDFKVVKKYVGIEGHRPKLYSLDTGAWEKAKQRAKKGAEDLAEELLKLYAARKNAPGRSFPEDTDWEKELAESFQYQETEDQKRAIEEVKEDLKAARPMERVVCGDVGFGKTEVAVRAAFKAVQGASQVAVLVPTTVLAEQHFQTFSGRLSPFPIKVAMLSRFQSKAEQKKVIEDIKRGLVDIVIGTHRLLQKDITFKDLGLLIIDEEHRFGVKQKEKIKSMKKSVDVLLLSATPIPRTLSLALSNLRDLSVIETPPYGRLPIETHLGPYDEKTVKRVIEAELSRGGQVFYVHNRVETIFSRADYLSKLVPGTKIGIVHGQLSAHEIEKTMWRFMHRELEMLVATTIIESGLDIPSANTMIIEEAENFGLAQLYQLRGRIGREKQKAYCYLFYTPELITEDSAKRLRALQEFGELGSGFRLALRDLEIRGAGNILSAEQHGFVRDIGFELYSRLIDEMSKKVKGEKFEKEEEWKTQIEFLLPAHIPEDYVSADDLRIIFYRRLASAVSEEEITSVKLELIDRFGPLPAPCNNLFDICGLRLLAEKLKVKSIIEDEEYVTVYVSEKIEFAAESVLKLAKDYEGVIEFVRGERPGIRLKKKSFNDSTVNYLNSFLRDLPKYAVIK